MITGDSSPQLQPGSYGNTESGQYAVVSYESTDVALIRQIAANIQVVGGLYDVEESFGKARITIHLANNPNAIEAPVDLWEYFGQRAEKDLLEADVPSGITATLSQKNIEVIRGALNGIFPDGGETLGSTDFTDGNQANALILYKLMLAGVRSAVARVPMLRHTQTVSNNWSVPASLTNVGRIISTAMLLSLESVPTSLLINLPNRVPTAFQTINVKYGWLKNDPTVQQVAFRKFQIVQEWEYGLWPTDVYGQPL